MNRFRDRKMSEPESHRAEVGRHRRLGRAAAAAILSSEQRMENREANGIDLAPCGSQSGSVAARLEANVASDFD